MNVGSLFSGIGGIDLGLERAGHTVVFQCESDGWRRDVLRERFAVPVHDDVRDVGIQNGWRRTLHDAADPRRDPAAEIGECDGGRVDLIGGGFPCQDLSVAGRRAGLMHQGGRSNLFFEFARVADELVRPGGYVLVENVPGLLSSNGGRDFAVVLATLAELGFHDLAWRVLDSRHFGVPQRRRRVFVVGRRARGQCCAEILLESESGGGHFASRREAGSDVAPALSGRSPSRLDDQGTGQLVAATLGSPRGHDEQASYVVSDLFDECPVVTELGEVGSLDTDVQGGFEIGGNVLSGPRVVVSDLDVEVGEDGAGHGSSLGETVTGGILQQSGAGEQVGDGDTFLPAPAPAVRRLTPVECERLQGFPDNWTRLDDSTPDSRRYAALGDAVTVNVAHWIGHRLMAARPEGRRMTGHSEALL